MPEKSSGGGDWGDLLGTRDENQRAALRAKLDSLQQKRQPAVPDPDIYLDLAHCYVGLGQPEAALDILEQGAAQLSEEGSAVHNALVQLLQKCGRDEEALAAAARASQAIPGNLAFLIRRHLYLPVLYSDEREISVWHQHFADGLEKCIAACDLSSREEALRVAAGLTGFTNYYLPYQGHDDLPLLRRYGEWVQRVMSAAFPEWSQPRAGRPVREKPRVGFVSAHFHVHTVAFFFQDWLIRRDPDRFDAHCYYYSKAEIGEMDQLDVFTERILYASDSFFQSDTAVMLCDAIRRDRPDVLVFTDVGLHSVTSLMATCRLAPVQCAAYGQPSTSGLPTIDYFLSSELMEPPDGQQHHTERLVLLPNLGVSYEKPLIPRSSLTKTRADFGLPETAVVYLCGQILTKCLPQFDRLIAGIAPELPASRFVFLAPNEPLRQKFLRRLETAFSAVGLRAADFCQVLPQQSILDFWNLHLVSDVLLDTPGWSGGRSTLDAVACGIPIVTLPGGLMRSRQAFAILTMLGVVDTIARDEADYVAIAVKLGRDPALRREIVLRMEAAHGKLYSDATAVRGFEQWISEVFRELPPAPPEAPSPDRENAPEPLVLGCKDVIIELHSQLNK